MTRCTKCILINSIPEVSLDAKGVCNFCHLHTPYRPKGKKALDKQISEILSKRPKGKYDCLVPISGGRDSTYVLYAAKKLYNLDVLAVTYDNEFSNVEAFENMKKACEALNVDHITFKNRWNLPKKIVKQSLLLSITLGAIWAKCLFCNYGIYATCYKMARKYNIPIILWGHVEYEEEGKIWLDIERKYKPFKLASNSPINIIKFIYHLFSFSFYLTLQRLELYVPGTSILHVELPKLTTKDIHEIYVFQYIEWDKNNIEMVIKNELNWKIPNYTKSTWRFDCLLTAVGNYNYYRKLGFLRDNIIYSQMIRDSRMSREESLMLEEENLAALENRLRYVLKYAGLKPKEVDKILAFK